MSNPLKYALHLSWIGMLSIVLSLYLLGPTCLNNNRPRMISKITQKTFLTAEVEFAAWEMQNSGEPFAEFELGRNLDGYDRNLIQTNLYDPDANPDTDNSILDPLGYSVAVESYEYSKYQMNTISYESSAGLSLSYGPVVNPGGVTGNAAVQLLANRIGALAISSHADQSWVSVPPPLNNPLNRYGFSGIWPVFAEFRSFDPTIQPDGLVTAGCNFTGGYGGSSGEEILVGDYECGYETLNLPNRSTQVEHVITPAALGFTVWKQSLWTANFLSIFHDVEGNTSTEVVSGDPGQIGIPGNTVVGDSGVAGSYIGSNDLEGFLSLLMYEEMQNKFVFLVKRMMTRDGLALTGFNTLPDALQYDYLSPLMWYPSEIAVQEEAGVGFADPRPALFTIQSNESRLFDLLGLLAGAAELYAQTDQREGALGSALTLSVAFDGNPFAADNGLPDGENTLHDRSLGIIKTAFITLDRLHVRPDSLGVVDTVTFTGSTPVQGSDISTFTTAYTAEILRIVLRALNGLPTGYSSGSPGIPVSEDLKGILNATPFSGAPEGADNFSDRVRDLIVAQGDFLLTYLTTDTGKVYNGFNVLTNTPEPSPTTLKSQASAIRGLLAAYLVTATSTYRDRARIVANRLEDDFWVKNLEIYRSVEGENDVFTYSPLVFGVTQGMLREFHKFGAQPGGQGIQNRDVVEARLLRLNKVILNGWDDFNGNNTIDANELLTGRLQQAERALTSELGSEGETLTSDRDSDGVPEIDDAQRSASLAAEIVIERL